MYFFSKVIAPMILFSIPTMSWDTVSVTFCCVRRSAAFFIKLLIPLEKSSSSLYIKRKIHKKNTVYQMKTDKMYIT